MGRVTAGRYDARTTFVIRDKRRWRHVWTGLQRTVPQPRRPRVDFRRKTVIAVLRGSGTGTGLRIEAVTRRDGVLARTPGPVRTERVERVVDCA